nr:hypothetical protein BSM_05220 [uncultured archaeon]
MLQKKIIFEGIYMIFDFFLLEAALKPKSRIY